jgi:3-hydroxyisobutyrate dehydrogenase-like beta-hydroxyacid dehydrogenase
VTRVAVVGTGRMGSAMARALARAGHELVLHNRTPDRAGALAMELGGTAATAATPAQAAAGADVVLTMLADDAAVESVFLGSDGLLAGARPGSVLADLSTVDPSTIRRVAAAPRADGVGLLDAPVSGSTQTAESGGLTLMVGGDPGDLDRARPVFHTIAKTVFHLGPLGSGAAMKLAVNTVIFGLNQALAEGLVLAERGGIDRALAYDVIAASVAGAPFVGYKRAAFLEPDTTPAAFALELADKDLRLITGFAEALGVPMPQARINLEQIRAAEAAGDPTADFSTVAGHLRGQTRTMVTSES